MKRTVILTCVTALIILGIVAYAYLHRFEIPVLSPHGSIALQERGIIGITVLMAGIVVVPVFVLLFLFAWKYRADNPKARRHHEPNWDHDNSFVEFLWWLVPTIIIIFLSVIAWQSSHALDPYKPLHSDAAPVTIQVIALDWKWLFIYPDQGIATVNMLEIPENTPIHFEITSDAPMNSFWIPSLGGQIMAMPGMTNQLNLMANGTGTFQGESANISGKGFAGMTFPTKSVSKDEFDAWVEAVRQHSAPLTRASYAQLAMPSEYVPFISYAPVDPQLYTTVIMSYLTPPMQMATSTQ